MALYMTGFVMILPLFARRFERFGMGVEALGTSAMAEEDSTKGNHSEIVVGALLVTSGDAPELLEAVDEQFDTSTQLVDLFVEWPTTPLVGLARDGDANARRRNQERMRLLL
jgi:hypothetical protein